MAPSAEEAVDRFRANITDGQFTAETLPLLVAEVWGPVRRQMSVAPDTRQTFYLSGYKAACEVGNEGLRHTFRRCLDQVPGAR